MGTSVTPVFQALRGVLNGRPFGIASVTEFGAVNDGIVDSTAAFNAALSSSATLIVVPPGFYLITGPLIIPANTGKMLLGLGGAKSVTLSVFMAAGNASRGVIEYLPSGQPNFAGCVLENLRIIGNNSVCHGVYLKDVSYPIISNVIIEGFDGAGLLLDKCQDGSCNNLAVVDCGRTAGNPSNNADTLYSGLHLITTIVDDHNNMLRFNDCQFENNRVLALRLDQRHGTHRNLVQSNPRGKCYRPWSAGLRACGGW